MIKKNISFALLLFVAGCAEIEPVPFELSAGHIEPEATPPVDVSIPDLVEQVPPLPEPEPEKSLERYTVVVNEVPVKELLFALARDAKVNIDIHPEIDGVVTINAVSQTLPQILKRISNQVDLRYEYDGDDLSIKTDTPFLRIYKVDYVNLSRSVRSESSVSTQIQSTSGSGVSGSSGGGGGGGGGSGDGNDSSTDISTESNNHFWARLVSNISAILGQNVATVGEGGQIPVTDTVIPNPESGLLTVRATGAQHEQIQEFIDQVLVSAKRQVLIQITIVEVTLNDRYRAGIDWQLLGGLLEIKSATLTGLSAFSTNTLNSFVVSNSKKSRDITATVTLLETFGNTDILSSPQIMVLNNQTALLKVVENFVYFEVDSDTTSTQGVVTQTFDTTARTVPIGIVMTVTPQIDANATITLNVRPTISRLSSTINDPNPDLIQNNTQIENLIPQISVREMESVLRMTDGEVGVLGGLMTNQVRNSNAGLPGVKDVDFWGNLFKSTSAEYDKKELVIFIKPTIINNPSLDGDLKEYKHYLSRNLKPIKPGEKLF